MNGFKYDLCVQGQNVFCSDLRIEGPSVFFDGCEIRAGIGSDAYIEDDPQRTFSVVGYVSVSDMETGDAVFCDYLTLFYSPESGVWTLLEPQFETQTGCEDVGDRLSPFLDYPRDPTPLRRAIDQAVSLLVEDVKDDLREVREQALAG